MQKLLDNLTIFRGGGASLLISQLKGSSGTTPGGRHEYRADRQYFGLFVKPGRRDGQRTRLLQTTERYTDTVGKCDRTTRIIHGKLGLPRTVCKQERPWYFVNSAIEWNELQRKLLINIGFIDQCRTNTEHGGKWVLHHSDRTLALTPGRGCAA